MDAKGDTHVACQDILCYSDGLPQGEFDGSGASLRNALHFMNTNTTINTNNTDAGDDNNNSKNNNNNNR